MPVPTHRPGCQTRLWQTHCHDCRKIVFYFSCSCGSKVYFDTKGPPWAMHKDSCPIYNARLMIEDGASPSYIRRLLDTQARNSGRDIPVELEAFLSRMGAGGKQLVNYMLPGDELVEICGRVIEINQVNFFKRFRIDNNIINRQIMGDFAEKEFKEITFDIEGDGRIVNRYCFVIPASEIDGYGLKPGATAYASIIGKSVYDENAVWLATEIDWD